MSDFSGVITALATPFYDGVLDEKSLVRLVRQQLDGGVRGFVVGGTTGESPTLTEAELRRAFDIVRGEAGKRTPVIVGTGTNSTQATIEKTKTVESWGADAALIVAPYYNRPPQRGLLAHFRAVARCTSLPVILYNVPSRTACSLEPAIVSLLAAEPNIVGIKEASGDLLALKELTAIAKPFWLISGDDKSGVDFCSLGGHGIISVVSHVIPKLLTKFVQGARNGSGDAPVEYRRYFELLRWMYCEANPIPVKWALKEIGIFRSAELRLPLIELDGSHQEGFRNCLKNLRLI